MFTEYTFWFVFAIVAAIIIFIDLYLTDHKKGKLGLKRSLILSSIWISVALIFAVVLYFYLENGPQKSLEFVTGYLIEYSLSVDNLFVFLMIFKVMSVPAKNQPHILKWGILSAIVFRILFILAGVGLVDLFHPVIYIFGIIIIYAAFKMAFGGEHKIDYEKNFLIKLIRKYFNVHTGFDYPKFFIRREGKIFATSLLLTLLLIESSDIVFAIDSIPAVIAITKDPFIIITSNIFAVLGLRSLYFALSGIVKMFYYLKYGVAIILFFVGIKMLISDFFIIPTNISLIVVVLILASSIILSLLKKRTDQPSDHKRE